MIRTELFKLRTHRTPWVLFTTLLLSLVVGPIYFAIKQPADATGLIDTFFGVFGVMAPLLGAVFGSWIFGHEFRQGTLRRVLGNDARRGRLIATKAIVGLGALLVGLATAAGAGALASLASSASFGGTLAWDGVFREVLGGGFLAILTATLALSFSILFRSDTYGMLGAVGLMLIVGPLLRLIPTVGKYTPSALGDDVTLWISGSAEPLGVAIATASSGLAATMALIVAGAAVMFQRSDV